MDTCLPYLQRQIEMIQPKILIALGKVAAQTLLGSEAGMAGLRNRLWQYRNIPLIVTFHPAYLLRNESALEEGVRDLQFALAQYQKNQPR
ncbi:MAG: hypothetical protein KDH97_22250 [Calditrichaeota bacterium]|nr:hypothetical protein [Calditrichota bacterium]